MSSANDWAGSPARLALQALPAAVIVYDAQHRLVIANQRMLELAGVDQRWLAPNTPLRDTRIECCTNNCANLAIRGSYIWSILFGQKQIIALL